MPIFSSQLGRVEEQSPEKGVKILANHIRKLQEELEYRLMNLDSSNINEIDASDTTVLVDGKEINNVLQDHDGSYAELLQSVNQLRLAVGSQGEALGNLGETLTTQYSTIEMTEAAILAAVQSVTGTVEAELKNYSTIEMTDSKIQTEVGKVVEGVGETLKSYSTIKQTEDAIAATVKTIDGKLADYSTIQQTTDAITSTVASKLQGYSTTTQTQSMIQAAVSGLDGETMLRLDEDGFIVAKNVDGEWEYVQIDGDQLIAGTVTANTIQGGEIALMASAGKEAGTLSLSSATSGAYAVELLSNAALRLTADDGAVYLDNAYGHLLIADNEEEGAVLQWGSSYIMISTNDGASSSEMVWVSGNILPTSDCEFVLGNTYYSWDDVYVQNESIVTSDRNRKKDIVYGMDHMDGFFDGLLPATYQLVKGKSGRRHGGLIAQDVKDNLDRNDISTQDFAGYVAWKNEDGTEGYALRYGEFIPLLIDQVQKLKARVGRLEGGTV